jgi:hypothetical protein
VNLLGLTAIPMGPESTWLTLYPTDSNLLLRAAQRLNVVLNGPHHALLVQGDDEMGALAGVLTKLAEADVNVFGSYAVADGKGHYGNIINLRPEHYERAARALHL